MPSLIPISTPTVAPISTPTLPPPTQKPTHTQELILTSTIEPEPTIKPISIIVNNEEIKEKIKIFKKASNTFFRDKAEEELEELIDLFGYETPLFSNLLETGDETPLYPLIFTFAGCLTLLLFFIINKKIKGS